MQSSKPPVIAKTLKERKNLIKKGLAFPSVPGVNCIASPSHKTTSNHEPLSSKLHTTTKTVQPAKKKVKLDDGGFLTGMMEAATCSAALSSSLKRKIPLKNKSVRNVPSASSAAKDSTNGFVVKLEESSRLSSGLKFPVVESPITDDDKHVSDDDDDVDDGISLHGGDKEFEPDWNG